MLYELQSLIHGSDIVLYKPVDDYSKEKMDCSFKDFLQVSAGDVVALSIGEGEASTPLDGIKLAASSELKDHDFSTSHLHDSDIRELSGVKLAQQVIDIWGCEEVQKSLGAGDFHVGLYINSDLGVLGTSPQTVA